MQRWLQRRLWCVSYRWGARTSRMPRGCRVRAHHCYVLASCEKLWRGRRGICHTLLLLLCRRRWRDKALTVSILRCQWWRRAGLGSPFLFLFLSSPPLGWPVTPWTRVGSVSIQVTSYQVDKPRGEYVLLFHTGGAGGGATMEGSVSGGHRGRLCKG